MNTETMLANTRSRYEALVSGTAETERKLIITFLQHKADSYERLGGDGWAVAANELRQAARDIEAFDHIWLIHAKN